MKSPRRGQQQHDAAWSNVRAIRLGLAALIPSLSLLSASCQAPSPVYFSELKIDSGLHVTLTGGLDRPYSQKPDLDSYFVPSYYSYGTSVDHYVRKVGAVASERSLMLETDHDRVLDKTVKTDEILKGPFGSINAVKQCFYTKPLDANGAGSVFVEFNFYDVEHEAPSEVSRPGESLPPLSSFSLVRVLRTKPGYEIVSASYERDGSLGRIDFASRDGDPAQPGQSGTSMYYKSDRAIKEWQTREVDPTLKKYGIPTQIDVQRYLLSREFPLPAVAFEQEKNVMHTFYGFGKFIRQDELKDGEIATSRWLQPSITDEERETLNPLCDARFLQQQEREISTVH